MPRPTAPDPDRDTARLRLRSPRLHPGDLAAANAVLDTWQGTLWQRPLAERQAAVQAMCEAQP